MTMRYNSGGVTATDKDNVDFQSDSTGNLKVTDSTGTAALTAVTGSKAAGTAAASSVLTGGVFNTAVPAPTNGQQVALQLDGDGLLKVKSDEVVLVDVTFAADTSILASGDIITSTATIAGAARANGGLVTLLSINVYDEDDQGTAIDFVLFRTNVSLGTVNNAPTISDANAREFAGLVQVAAADFSDLGGVRVATKTGITTVIAADAASKDLFCSLICRSGTPTYTASGIRARFGFKRH